MIREYCGKVKLASVLCSAALPGPINQLFALQESNPQPTNYKHGPQHYDRQAGGPADTLISCRPSCLGDPNCQIFCGFQ